MSRRKSGKRSFPAAAADTIILTAAALHLADPKHHAEHVPEKEVPAIEFPMEGEIVSVEAAHLDDVGGYRAFESEEEEA